MEFNSINCFVSKKESYPKPFQTSKKERFVKIVKDFQIFGRVPNTLLVSDNLLVFRNGMKISRKRGPGAKGEEWGSGGWGQINLKTENRK